MIKLKHLLMVVILAIAYSTVMAQKLPNVQQASLRAPADISIDGKATEWNNQFQAYNHATDIYYALCNDDNNLYLIIQASDPDVLTKITNRGVVLSINTSGKKKDENAISINYPVFELKYGNKPYIAFTNSGMLHSQRVAMEQNPDSVSMVANKKLRDNEKFILTNNIPGIDTLLSIYNREGISAAEAFDSTMAYTYELSINLKLLNLNANNHAFAYHIILHGLTDDDFGLKSTTDADGHFHISVAPGANGAIPKKEHLAGTSSTTDFWGEYVLATKK